MGQREPARPALTSDRAAYNPYRDRADALACARFERSLKMVFFTRELYLGMQPQSGWERRAEREWERRAVIYARYAKAIAEMLPPAVRKLGEHGLHDAVVREAFFADGELALVLDAANSMGKFRGKDVRLTFRGVRGRPAVSKLVGQWWLYDEAHLRSGGRFCLSILFDPAEIEIEADELTIETA